MFLLSTASRPALGTGSDFTMGKTVGKLSWPFTSILCRGQEWWSYTSIHHTSSFFLYGSRALWTLAAFSVSNLYTVDRTPWMWHQPVARPLPTHRATETQNERTQTSMPWVGFKPTIPVFERAKTVHALDCVVTAIGMRLHGVMLN
jgi:hypothetical protein